MTALNGRDPEANFERELADLINKYSKEKFNHTPDFLLAKFINRALDNYTSTVMARDNWHGISRVEAGNYKTLPNRRIETESAGEEK